MDGNRQYWLIIDAVVVDSNVGVNLKSEMLQNFIIV